MLLTQLQSHLRGPLPKLVKDFLDGIPSLQHVDHIMQLVVISKFAGSALSPTAYVARKDTKWCWNLWWTDLWGTSLHHSSLVSTWTSRLWLWAQSSSQIFIHQMIHLSNPIYRQKYCVRLCQTLCTYTGRCNPVIEDHQIFQEWFVRSEAILAVNYQLFVSYVS